MGAKLVRTAVLSGAVACLIGTGAGGQTITVTAPNGGETWVAGTTETITWAADYGGSKPPRVDIHYSTDGGSSWTLVVGATLGDGSHPWLVPWTPSSNCRVRVREPVLLPPAGPSDTSDGPFTIAPPEHTVSAPDAPSGRTFGVVDTTYSYSLGGSACSWGHPVQYRVEFGDGSHSGWLAAGATSVAHAWTYNDTFQVTPWARCSVNTAISAPYSHLLPVVIRGDFANSPASRVVITEVNLSSWTSQVVIVDVTGGSVVSAFYCSGTSRRGPFLLWDNTGGATKSSISFPNIVATLDALDGSATNYSNTSGALELVTQDCNHLIQAAVRTANTGDGGLNSRTFPALAPRDAYTASGSLAGGRQLLIPNLSNDADYRCSVVVFNPDEGDATAEVRLFDGLGRQIVTSGMKVLRPHEMWVVIDSLRARTYSHATALVLVRSAYGRVMASGQTAHWGSTDPAAHVAMQASQQTGTYPNCPGQYMYITEVNWTTPWVSEVNIVDVAGGATVQAEYFCGGGPCGASPHRGPFPLWDNAGGAALSSTTLPNILEAFQGQDPGFTYHMTSGSLRLSSDGAARPLHAAVRTMNGGFSRTFPAVVLATDNAAALSRTLLIPNISNNAEYRSSVVLLSLARAHTVDVKVIDDDGLQVGEAIPATVNADQMVVLDDELRTRTYSNATVVIDVTSGGWEVLASGQTARYISNDPAAHIAVQAD